MLLKISLKRGVRLPVRGNRGPSKLPAISVNTGVALCYWQTANGVSAGELDSHLQQDRQEVSGTKLLFTEMTVI